MEVVVNKQFLESMLFILFAVSSLVMTIQATEFKYCDGSGNYPLQVQHLDVAVHAGNKFRTVTTVSSNKDLVLDQEPETGYQIYFTDNGFPKLEEFPFPQSLTHGQSLKIDHSHSWPIGRTPTNVTIQIDTQSTLESEKPWLCISFVVKICHSSISSD